jgi:Tol biopolymer transport system component
VLFAEGVVSTGEFESHPAFTPDGRTLYFVRSNPQFTDWKIYVTQNTNGVGEVTTGDVIDGHETLLHLRPVFRQASTV